MKLRSRWFVLSGGLGGLLGFALMEARVRPPSSSESWWEAIVHMAIYFAGFGLAVGAALGVTEGILRRRPGRAVYGLLVGLVLGGIGGFVGGAVAQAIFGLAPQKYASRSTTDIAIALDSSGSMSLLLVGGNDPHGERKKAAKQLIERVSDTDRIAVVDFDDVGNVLYPLTLMSSEQARSAARDAVDQVDDSGGTNLSAGLDAGVAELSAHRDPKRKQFLIFLTDGQGAYEAGSATRAKNAGITIYTVGLGDEVDAGLMGTIAAETGGKYFPVRDAAALTALFEQIRTLTSSMTQAPGTEPVPDAQPVTNWKLMYGLRILCWALMGLAIGLGQGVRENTREDLFACSLGGFIGGAIGGALFDPLGMIITFKAGLAGRALADVVVGACTGGSMRLAQEKIVEASGKSTTVLFSALPTSRGVSMGPRSEEGGPTPARPAPGPQAVTPPRPEPIQQRFVPSYQAPIPIAPAKPVPTYQAPIPIAPAKPVPPMERAPVNPPSAPTVPVTSNPVSSNRPPLATFEVGVDRDEAMRRAHKAGYGYSEIAKHFGVAAPAVRRIVTGG